MGLPAMMVLTAATVSVFAAASGLGRRKTRSASSTPNDRHEAEEMLAAFGTSQEWV